jgi:hypothetical protein
MSVKVTNIILSYRMAMRKAYTRSVTVPVTVTVTVTVTECLVSRPRKEKPTTTTTFAAANPIGKTDINLYLPIARPTHSPANLRSSHLPIKPDINLYLPIAACCCIILPPICA